MESNFSIDAFVASVHQLLSQIKTLQLDCATQKMELSALCEERDELKVKLIASNQRLTQLMERFPQLSRMDKS